MYEFWYNYVKPKYGENAKLCYMDTNSFIVYIKTDVIYTGIAKDIEARLGTSSYELDRPLLKGKNKKVVSLMKREVGGKIMKEFAALGAKRYSYFTTNNDEDRKEKTKKCFIKRKLQFEDYKNC